MPKGIRVNAISNEIEYVTHNGKGLITGKREDITDEAIKAVFQHLRNEFNKEATNDSFGYYYKGLGTIKYFPEDHE